MELSISLKQSQKLALTPQLQQALKILQLPIQDLVHEINTALEENPFLSVNEMESDSSEVAEDRGELLWENGYSSNSDIEDWDWEEAPQTLCSYLLEQLGCLKIPSEKKLMVEWIIGSLDHEGILTEPLDTLANSFPVENSFSIQQWQAALELLQTFDPPGIGAKDKIDILLLQLKHKRLSGSSEEVLQLSEKIISTHLDLLAKHQFDKLKKSLDCNDVNFKAAVKVISELDPRPTSPFSDSNINFVVPEITVTKTSKGWGVRLLDHFPKIELNHLYADACRSCREENDFKLWKGKLEEAKFFLKNIEQRKQSVLNVSSLIVERQQDFFDFGPEKLKPLVLREIADTLGIHESTVSRITNGKYLICPRGTFELKYFFSSAHFAAGTSSEEVSAGAIKAELKKIIQSEPSEKPYSDSKLSDLLEQRGYKVARRTVAKYREQLNYPSASLRKKL